MSLSLDSVLTESDFEEIGRSFYRLQQVSANQGLLDFAAKPKQCSKGYSCKSTCISKNRSCANPLAGQAKDYAGWLKLQIAAGAKLSPSQQADAQAQGLTSQPATKATKTTKAKATKSTPPPPKPRTETDEIADALEKGDFATLTEQASKLYERAKQAGGSNFYAGVQKTSGGGSGKNRDPDFILAQLWKDRGYDGTPTVVSKAVIDANIKAGEIVMFRAVGSSQARFQQHFNDFKTGDYFAGRGIFGNGTYVGHAKKALTAQRKAYDGAYSYGSGMMRMTLDKAATVVKQTDVAKEVRDARAALDNWAKQERQRILQGSGNQGRVTKAAFAKEVKAVKDDLVAKGFVLKPEASFVSKNSPLQAIFLYPDPNNPSARMNLGLPLGNVMKNGANDFTATDTKGNFLGFYGTAAQARKALANRYFDDEADTRLQQGPTTVQGLKDLDDKVRRTQTVLFGDSGGSQSGSNDGVSGRFATIKGYDAISLNDSYDTSYMVLLNRAKTRVQDTDNKGNRP